MHQRAAAGRRFWGYFVGRGHAGTILPSNAFTTLYIVLVYPLYTQLSCTAIDRLLDVVDGTCDQRVAIVSCKHAIPGSME
jgi:hypothetical protein